MNFITRLNQYLSSVENTPFKWGKHDCFVFTNTAFEKMHGQPYADEWKGQYLKEDGKTLVSISSLRNKFRFDNIVDAVDSKLVRKDVPVIGDLVFAKHANNLSDYVLKGSFGICYGDLSAFVGYQGLEYLDTSLITHAWGRS